jgi:hypothetical protein
LTSNTRPGIPWIRPRSTHGSLDESFGEDRVITINSGNSYNEALEAIPNTYGRIPVACLSPQGGDDYDFALARLREFNRCYVRFWLQLKG